MLGDSSCQQESMVGEVRESAVKDKQATGAPEHVIKGRSVNVTV